jgi:hypothetical protein
MMIEFAKRFKRVIKWSKKTFGPNYSYAGIIDHIRKELIEIEEQPYDLFEWIDCVILSLDGAWRCATIQYPKATPEELVEIVLTAWKQKSDINEKRSWPDWKTAEPGKAITHVKDDTRIDVC